MDREGIDVSVVYRTFAHMVVSIDDLEPAYATAPVVHGAVFGHHESVNRLRARILLRCCGGIRG
jgi:hypothetical protein